MSTILDSKLLFLSIFLYSNEQGGEGGQIKQHIQLVTVAVSGVYIIGRREKMAQNRRLPQIKENGAKNSRRDDKERNCRRKKSQVAENLHHQKAESGATKRVQYQADKLVQNPRCDARNKQRQKGYSGDIHYRNHHAGSRNKDAIFILYQREGARPFVLHIKNGCRHAA